MIPAADRWGPFVPDLDAAERRARPRSLRALAGAYCGPQTAETCLQLFRAVSALAGPSLTTRALKSLGFGFGHLSRGAR